MKIVLKWKKLTKSLPIHAPIRFDASVCGNPKLSSTVSCKRKKKKNVVLPVTASVVGAFILVLIVVATWWVFLTKKRQGKTSTSKTGPLIH